MCTLIVMTRLWDEASLVIAANRDERYNRPASPPRLHPRADNPVFAPVDDQGGGTWIGLSQRGVVAAITNRHWGDHDPSRESRGALVYEALLGSDVDAGLERISVLSPETFNPFHLLVADRTEAGIIWSDGRRFRRLALTPGLHVITEGSFRETSCARQRWLSTDPMGWTGRSACPSTGEMATLLATGVNEGPVAVCISAPGIGYGTRSASILRLGPAAVEWSEATGPPNQVDFQSQAALLPHPFGHT